MKHEPINQVELLNWQTTPYLKKHKEGLIKLWTHETIESLEIIYYIIKQRETNSNILNCQGICDGSCKDNCINNN